MSMANTARRQSKRLLQYASQPKPVVGTRQQAAEQATSQKPSKPRAKLGKTRAKAEPTHEPVQAPTDSTSGSAQERLLVPDASAWRVWLDQNESSSDGVWLVLAKKGATTPTSLTRAQALEEALCSGWIDSQAKSLDDYTSLQRYTPRRAKSLWSAVNVRHVTRLREEGRMGERGEAEVMKAQEDGRWDRAYEGPRNMTVPPEVTAALKNHPGAKRKLDDMKSMDRYFALLPIVTAQTEAAKTKRIEKLVEDLRK